MSHCWMVLVLLMVGCAGDKNESPDHGDDPTAPAPEPTTTQTPGPTTTLNPLIIDAVTVSPHPEFPTILVVTWEQSADAEVHVVFSVDVGEQLVSPLRTLAAGAHEEWILGVPYDTDVTWNLVAIDAEGTTESNPQVTRTGLAPLTLPLPRVWIDEPAQQDPDSRYLFTALNEMRPGFNDTYYTLFLDRRGRVVWARPSPQSRVTLHPRPSVDGATLLIDHNSFWSIFDSGAASEVVRLTIDGNSVSTLATPGLHHAYTDLPDGTLAYAATQNYNEERIVTVAPDGTLTPLWSCQEWLQGIGEAGACNSNTLNHDVASGSYLLSLYSLDTIIEVDALTGATNRWFGHVPGSYAFDPLESTFWWQHGSYYTTAGTLLVSSDLTDAGVETIVREYTVDTTNQTLTEIWSFGVGDGVFGGEMGEPHRLGNGNILHNTGALPRVREATSDGTVVWDLQWASEHEIGRSTFVPNLYAFAPDRP